MDANFKNLLTIDSPGVLCFGGARMALLDIEAGFWGIRNQMEALVGQHLSDQVLQQAGANGGASFAASFTGEVSEAEGEQALRDVIAAYQVAGFGRFEIESIEWPIGRVIIHGWDLFEAWAAIKHDQVSERPVCAYTAGVLVGFVNVLGSRMDVVCIKRTCQAQGAEVCVFELLPAEVAGDTPIIAMAPDPSLGHQLNLLELLFDRMPMGIAILDRDFYLRRYNPTWADFAEFYAPPSASRVAPGVFYFDLLPGSEPTVIPLFERVLAGETIRQEATRLESGGIVTYWDMVLTPLFGNGEVTGILNITVDATERIKAEVELKESEANLRSLLENAKTFVVYRVAVDESHPYGGRIVMVSPSITDIAGVTDPFRFESFFENIHPEDLPGVVEANQRAWERGESYSQPVRVFHPKKDQWIWLHTVSTPVFDADGKLTHFNGLIIDITEQKRTEAIDVGQRKFLELLATGGSFSETLHTLVQIIEEQWPGMLGLILLLDEDGKHLRHGAAISLPEEYTQSVDGLEIGPMVGSCGTASFLGERVIVEDIATDPRWDDLRELGLEYGLRACWSEPVFSAGGQVVGTFAMYYRHPRAPTEAELQTIETAAHLVGVAIESRQTQEDLQKAYWTMEQRLADRTKELSALNAIAASVSGSQDLQEILRIALKQTLKVSNIEAGGIYLFNEVDELLTIAVYEGIDQEFVAEIDNLKVGEGFSGSAFRTREPVVVQDLTGDHRLTRESVRDKGFQSMAVVPLLSRQKVLGTIFIISRSYREFSPEDIELLTSIGHQIGTAVEIARLYEQSQAAAVIDERQRLARDLHDAVTQTLFAASLTAEALPHIWERHPSEGRQRLDKLRTLTQGALAEMRTLLLELRPATLVNADIEDLLHQLAESTTGRAGVPVEVELDGECILPNDVKIALYRIAQEALNNTAKHSEAGKVTVRLFCQADGVELVIQDDGCGFDPSSVSPHKMGLGIMRERAESIGATIEIESQAGQGTQIRTVYHAGKGKDRS